MLSFCFGNQHVPCWLPKQNRKTTVGSMRQKFVHILN